MKKMRLKEMLSLAAMLALSTLAYGQAVVSGKVQDRSSKETLIGVNIVEKGTMNGTIGDVTGGFELTTKGELPVTLLLSFVGYEPRELVVTSTAPITVNLVPSSTVLGEFIVTARRRMETAQAVPIAISVIGGTYVEDAQAFNVNRVKELVPTVQLYSQNPRNTSLNIRGLGQPFGLTNDGLDPGVGFYVDGVYYTRPVATSLDFIDIDQVEVLRGPQGTLFGKNTTAGAFNITTRRPTFEPSATIETSFGNYNFVQSRGAVSGGLNDKLALRLSYSATQRDGNIQNIRTEQWLNDLNNVGVRGQLIYKPSEKVEVLFSADFTRQRPDGYAQVIAGVTPTLRPDFRQFDNIIADLNYELPSRNPFDRIVDHDGVWKSGQDMGGTALNIAIDLGPGTLTSTTAWRYWDWMPSNDRDYTGLPVTTLSQAPSMHHQVSQEEQYAGDINDKLSGVIGVFAIGQDLKSNPYHTE
jgi:iron complex outermembrane receptor protein